MSPSFTQPIAVDGLLRDLLEALQEGVMITDAQDRILAVNSALCRLTGHSRDALLGNGSALLYSDRQEPGFHAAIRDHAVATGVWEGEIWNRRADGEVVLDRLCLHAHRDKSGNLAAFIALFNDAQKDRREMAIPADPERQDELTGLAKFRPLAEHLRGACERARRENLLLAVICLDLDGFKEINDRHGQSAGDILLTRLAQRLRGAAHAPDAVARMGGDEFALVIEGVPNMDEVEQAAHRVMAMMEVPCEVDGREHSVSASLGVTVFPFDNADPETLLRHASQAMITAKRAGRKRFHLFDAEQDHLDHTRGQVLQRLRLALAREEFELHYQPKVNLRTGKVVGLEALLRWRHPERGLVPPGEFLPLAEEDDIIIDIGEWVMRTVLAQIEAWEAGGLELNVSVNIAARQLQRADFIDCLHQCLTDHPGVPDGRLELEILESAALENTAHVRDVISTCQRLGVGFALDDFGTGYASLSYLRDIPADVLKIDQRFVRNILEEGDDLTLVDGIISLANAFRRIVVAEGVETPEQGVLLLRLGCDIAQGYGIARPMPAEKVPDWVDEYRPPPQWSLWADTQWEMVDFPLLVAQYDHIKWVKQVVLYVEGATLQLAEHELIDHHQCRFGHWYYGHGMLRYGQLQAFMDLESVHARVHQLGPEIVALRVAGKFDEARTRVPDLLALKDQILDGLTRLQEAVAARSTTPHMPDPH